eukprot:CAMPEP_0169259376 /NCGR_PEP_ID=MMETSP1016-20121227/41937_1 /TAXON_ID=342587 /ORGANISM="Karlodinium micrum, Strain CCMP2283" /LENGTH=118 /DNA_ID=CAMNT_0009341423 /DNA_START=430 /DNA_END=786 /DNA_ORIENTATION=-
MLAIATVEATALSWEAAILSWEATALRATKTLVSEAAIVMSEATSCSIEATSFLSGKTICSIPARILRVMRILPSMRCRRWSVLELLAIWRLTPLVRVAVVLVQHASHSDAAYQYGHD